MIIFSSTFFAVVARAGGRSSKHRSFGLYEGVISRVHWILDGPPSPAVTSREQQQLGTHVSSGVMSTL
jgi:hypothetical protein